MGMTSQSKERGGTWSTFNQDFGNSNLVTVKMFVGLEFHLTTANHKMKV